MRNIDKKYRDFKVKYEKIEKNNKRQENEIKELNNKLKNFKFVLLLFFF